MAGARLCLGGPTVNRGPEPVTTIVHGNLCERRISRAADGVGGSVAGSARVCEGIADCVARSSTVRLDGVNVTS